MPDEGEIGAALIAGWGSCIDESALNAVPYDGGVDLVMLLAGALVWGMTFTLTLYGQQVLGYSALKFGLGTAFFGLWQPSARSLPRVAVSRPGDYLAASGGANPPVALNERFQVPADRALRPTRR
jgi:hypothetical protein